MEEIVRMVDIRKEFPGVIANDNVCFGLRRGEIHALLGENGAGKTTLVSILAGLYEADGGEIYVWGRRVKIACPMDAIKLGIFMVPQTPKIVESMTVAENLSIGLKSAGLIFPVRKIKRIARRICEKYNIHIDLDVPAYRLSVSEQKRLEILRAIIRNAKILIFDEITNLLAPYERREIYEFMRKYVEDGNSIIFVTHKISEAMAISDRITVMRKGKVVGTVDSSNVTSEKLTAMMFGAPLTKHDDSVGKFEGDMALEVMDLWVKGDHGRYMVRGVSFVVRYGESVGIVGVAGNGQRELVEAIMGLRKPERGRIYIMVDGTKYDLTKRPASYRLMMGVGYIPDDRIRHGIIPDMSVAENLILGRHSTSSLARLSILRWNKIKKIAEAIVKKYGIVTPNIQRQARFLSGGNIQKLILARELEKEPRIIVAVNPTQGLDAKTVDYMREVFAHLKSEGKAILLISEDIDEVLMLADRISVISDGMVSKFMDRREATVEAIGSMMARVRKID